MWNVNYTLNAIPVSSGGRINRNIVECKFLGIFKPIRKEPGESIETLWNVNRKEYVIRLLYTLESIETLWNVNLSLL